jgi:hypothetical protein
MPIPLFFGALGCMPKFMMLDLDQVNCTMLGKQELIPAVQQILVSGLTKSNISDTF